MRIPGGDLVPARRHRYGGSLAHHRRRRRRRLLSGLVVLVVLAAAAWYLLEHHHHRRVTAQPVAVRSCATAAPSALPVAVPQNRQVRVVLRNGTTRQGLARALAQQLAARGFVVVRADNNPAPVAGASVVTYPPGLQVAAAVLAGNVEGARVSSVGDAPLGTVQLVIGSGFVRLTTPAQAAAARAALAAVPARSPAAGRPCAAIKAEVIR